MDSPNLNVNPKIWPLKIIFILILKIVIIYLIITFLVKDGKENAFTFREFVFFEIEFISKRVEDS